MFNKRYQKAFTLLEVIVAITVLTIAVGGSFALIQQTMVAASLNQSKLTAYYLAQEGIELVRNIRDSNWLEQRANPTVLWKEGLGAGDWEADFNDSGLVQPFVGEGRFLNVGSEGFYTYSGESSTPFKRKITIAEMGSNALEVTVQVLWSERGRDHQVEVKEHIYNWYGY